MSSWADICADKSLQDLPLMEFFLHDADRPVAESPLCPDFPKKIGWE